MDNFIEKKEDKFSKKSIAVRFIKATVKATVVYVLYSLFSMLMSSFDFFHRYQTTSTLFIILYIAFIFLAELSRGTIYQHAFAITNSLIVVLYFFHMISQGEVNLAVGNFNLIVDLRFFLSIFVLGSIVGFARSLLQLLSWMHEREEHWLRYQIKSL